MNIYKISQSINNGYDTYDSAVVIAENEDDARTIHPLKYVTHHKDGKWYGTHSVAPYNEYETENNFRSWLPFDEIHKIDVEFIGVAKEDSKKGGILSSFNAG